MRANVVLSVAGIFLASFAITSATESPRPLPRNVTREIKAGTTYACAIRAEMIVPGTGCVGCKPYCGGQNYQLTYTISTPPMPPMTMTYTVQLSASCTSLNMDELCLRGPFSADPGTGLTPSCVKFFAGCPGDRTIYVSTMGTSCQTSIDQQGGTLSGPCSVPSGLTFCSLPVGSPIGEAGRFYERAVNGGGGSTPCGGLTYQQF